MITEVPSAPQGPLRAADITKDSITLSWQPPKDDGGSPLTSYVLDKLDLQWGGWKRATKVPPNATSTTLTGLIKGHDYNFRIYAENKVGVSEPIELIDAVKAKSLVGKSNSYQGANVLSILLMTEPDSEVLLFTDVPSAPRDFEITEVTDDSATLEWSPPASKGGADIIGYPVERREAGRMNWVRIKRVEPDVTWFTVESLLEGRGYIFRVFAENCEGLSEPAVIEKTVVPQRKLGTVC